MTFAAWNTHRMETSYPLAPAPPPRPLRQIKFPIIYIIYMQCRANADQTVSYEFVEYRGVS